MNLDVGELQLSASGAQVYAEVLPLWVGVVYLWNHSIQPWLLAGAATELSSNPIT
jgi:hypothetical protein